MLTRHSRPHSIALATLAAATLSLTACGTTDPGAVGPSLTTPAQVSTTVSPAPTLTTSPTVVPTATTTLVPPTPSATTTSRPTSRPRPTTTPGTRPTTSLPPAPSARFSSSISAVTASDVRYTYREGCPVGPSGLRKIEMTFRGYDGVVKQGVLIVAADVAADVTASFKAAFDAGFRIRRMDNPNLWHGDDELMMAADNTSAFNCRQVTGNASRMSPHSYGTAIDVNTRRNPYLAANDVWYPENGARWQDRSLREAGMIFASSTLTREIIGRGGIWGGNWSDPDYQHFEMR